MKILIAKSIMQEKSPLLEPLFAPFSVKSREDYGDVIEYTVDGQNVTVEPLFDGKKFIMNSNGQIETENLNLAVPGAKFKDFLKGEIDASQIQVTGIDEINQPEKKNEKPTVGAIFEIGSVFAEEKANLKIKDVNDKDIQEPDPEIKITVKKDKEDLPCYEVAKSKKIKAKNGKYLEPGAIFTEQDLAEGQTTANRMCSWHWCSLVED